VLPPIVTGYLLLMVLSTQSHLGAFLKNTLGLQFPFTTMGATLAATIVSLPLLIRSVRLSIELIDPDLEQASLTLGSGPVTTFFRVTLPLAIPGILTGTILAFARSLGEFGATVTLAGNIEGETRTIPLAINTLLQQRDGEFRVWRLVLISVVLSLAALIVSEWIARRIHRQLGGRR